MKKEIKIEIQSAINYLEQLIAFMKKDKKVAISIELLENNLKALKKYKKINFVFIKPKKTTLK